jgi:hypothetical protein
MPESAGFALDGDALERSRDFYLFYDPLSFFDFSSTPLASFSL